MEKNSPPREGKPTYSDRPARDFLHYVLHKTDKHYKNIVLSHNGGRYDNVLMAKLAYETPGMHVSMVSRGNKIFKMVLKKGRSRNPYLRAMTPTIFQDSFNIMPRPLDALPKTLGLNMPGKSKL